MRLVRTLLKNCVFHEKIWLACSEMIVIIIFLLQSVVKMFFHPMVVEKGIAVALNTRFCVNILRRKDAKRETCVISYIKQILCAHISKGANVGLARDAGFYIRFVNILKKVAEMGISVEN